MRRVIFAVVAILGLATAAAAQTTSDHPMEMDVSPFSQAEHLAHLREFLASNSLHGPVIPQPDSVGTAAVMVMAPAELGGNAWSAAATSFALFTAGAIFPVAPFLWMKGHWATGTSVAASAAALCAIGALTSLFNGRGAGFSALRQLVFGCLAAAVTYGIGAALGTSLS